MGIIRDMPIYQLYFYAFSFLCSIPLGLLVCLVVSLRVKWLKYRFKIDTLGKSYPLGKVGILLCLLPGALMAVLFLISIVLYG